MLGGFDHDTNFAIAFRVMHLTDRDLELHKADPELKFRSLRNREDCGSSTTKRNRCGDQLNAWTS